MLYLKACPRCHGDLLLQEVVIGETEMNCLQCGYAASVRPPAPPVADAPRPQPVYAGERRLQARRHIERRRRIHAA